LKEHIYKYSAFEFAKEFIKILGAEASMLKHQTSRTIQIGHENREFKAGKIELTDVSDIFPTPKSRISGSR
jgi:hypothetical protein